jgi:hypothetical protein
MFKFINEDGSIDREMLELAAKQACIDTDNADMEICLKLSAAGWEAQKPVLNHVPDPNNFWDRVRPMSWKWRRPSRRPGKPGRLFHSTNQAWRSMLKELGSTDP